MRRVGVKKRGQGTFTRANVPCPLCALLDLEHRELSVAALHALLRLGLVLHGTERDSDTDERNIQHVMHRRLSADSCFILSEEGVHLAYALARLRPAAAANRPAAGRSATVPSFVTNNDGSRTLTFMGHVVREYHRYAQFQELVLATFQAKGWPERIADPLPLNTGINPKRHLRQIISRLNLKQTTPLLRFHGDGSGRAACWQPQ
jgi:hypothetical protein